MKQRNYLRTIVILIIAELAITALLLSGPPRYLQVTAVLSHVLISIWAGLILNWLAANNAANRGAVIAYWIMLIVGFTPIQWFIALYLVMKSGYRSMPPAQASSGASQEQPARAEQAGDGATAISPPSLTATPASTRDPVVQQQGRSWPVFAAILTVLIALFINLLAAMLDTSEFRGLTMLYTHALLITPIMLATPVLLLLAASERAKPLVVVCLVLTYLLLTTSWLVFLLG